MSVGVSVVSGGSTPKASAADSPPPRHDDPWSYEEYHIIGDQWQRKTGHNAMEWADQSHRPCLTNESQRFPDNDSNPHHAYDSAMGGALLCGGTCYHSAAGKTSTLFTGVELECAQAFVDGARSVPLEFQRGQYHHRPELEGPDCIRAYDRTLPDGRAHVVKIRP